MHKCMKSAVIWGNGQFYKEHAEELACNYTVQMIVDSYNTCPHDYIKVETPSILKFREFDIYVVMIKDVKNIFDVIHTLHKEYKVEYKKIVLGKSIFDFDDNIQWGDIDDKGRVELKIQDYCLRIGSYNEFYNVEEVLINRVYSYYINNGKNDVVIDVGMNIGDSTLFFLGEEKVRKVFAYEPFKHTYENAKDNLKKYWDDKEQLEAFCVGLSDVCEKRRIGFNKNMPCAQSTISSVREDVYKDFHDRGIAYEEDEESEEIIVVDSADEIRRIVDEYAEEFNIVIKLDCEGEEYRIVEELNNTGLLKKIDFIMMEWHYEGNKRILECLKESGFSYWHSYKSSKMGQVYAYRS